MTEQFYFGRQDRKLFGVFHQALKPHPGASAILLCNPFGPEAIAVNRLFRVLAGRLAGAGVPVLRFDYYGCGDAAGSDDDFRIPGAAQDILTAHQELLDRAGPQRRIAWVGLRLGGSLALRAAAAARRGPRQLVLWDTIVDGGAYLSQLRSAHVSTLASVMDLSISRVQIQKAADLEGQVMGFALADDLAAEIRELDLVTLVQTRPARQATVISDANSDEGARLQESLVAQDCKTALHPIEEDRNWLADINHDPQYLPHSVIRLLVEQFAGGGAA